MIELLLRLAIFSSHLVEPLTIIILNRGVQDVHYILRSLWRHQSNYEEKIGITKKNLGLQKNGWEGEEEGI